MNNSPVAVSPAPKGAGDTAAPLLTVTDLKISAGSVTILDGVSFQVEAGRTLGIVGESGSGKSMTSLAILGLLPRGVRVTGGSVDFQGADLLKFQDDARRSIRGKEISMVFQDPLAALNPVMRIGDQVGEILRRRDGLSRKDARLAAIELMNRVEIPESEVRFEWYPHQFSGGLRQRAVIAMALAGQPRLVLADEPTTALDVTVQGRILRLLQRLQREDDLSMILISHDLRVISHFADDIVVMRHGTVVESGKTASVLANPEADYTAELIRNVPAVHRKILPAISVDGAES